MIRRPFATPGWFIMASVAANLRRLSACSVLVAGDAMLDRYWFGPVERISPEAPVPVVTVNASEERIGGAGNVACNIASLGGKCTLLSVVGNDEAGNRVAEIATHSGITHQLVVDQLAKTTIKLRVLSRNQQLLRADFESPPGARALDETTANIQTLIELATQKHLPVLVDPKGGNFARYRGATLVTPNLKELEQVAGTVVDDQDMDVKAAALMQRHCLNKLLVTLSDRGMVLYDREGGVLRREARAREVYDVSGAGDSVVAVMAMATAAGLDDDTGLHLANSAAGVVVSKLGTATASVAELKAALRRDYPR